MNRSNYLKRLKINRDIQATLGDLKLIHRNHLLSIPFENLDIHMYSSINVEENYLFNKIITHGRGGICYELNYLLYLFLRESGFGVSLLGGSVFDNHESELDHLFIKVSLGGNDYLADVGFGDNFLEPLVFICDREQHDAKGIFKIEQIGEDEYRLLKKVDGQFVAEYTFTGQSRGIEECYSRMEWMVKSEDSIFRRNLFCSLERERGRISLKQNKMICSRLSSREEMDLNSFEEYYAQLAVFDIKLDRREQDLLKDKYGKMSTAQQVQIP